MMTDTFDDLVREPTTQQRAGEDCPLTLYVTKGSLAGNTFVAKGPAFRLGRQPDCDLQLDASQDLRVSGSHAIITQLEGRWTVEDDGSSNGTFLNGTPIKSPVRISDGDVISLGPEALSGSVTLSVGSPGPEGQSAASRPSAPAVSPSIPRMVGLAGMSFGTPSQDESDVQPGGFGLVKQIRSKFKDRTRRKDLRAQIEDLSRRLPGAVSKSKHACASLGEEAWERVRSACTGHTQTVSLEKLDQQRLDIRQRLEDVDREFSDANSDADLWIANWNSRREPVETEATSAKEALNLAVEQEAECRLALQASLMPLRERLAGSRDSLEEVLADIDSGPSSNAAELFTALGQQLRGLAETLSSPVEGLTQGQDELDSAQDAVVCAEVPVRTAREKIEELEAQKVAQAQGHRELTRELDKARTVLRTRLEAIEKQRLPDLEALGESLARASDPMITGLPLFLNAKRAYEAATQLAEKKTRTQQELEELA